MTGEPLTIALLMAAGLVLVLVWTAGARTGHRAERAVREVTRIGGNAARALLAAVVVVGVQWAVIRVTDHPAALAAVLGVPALFAGVTAARLLAVTQVVRTLPRGGRR